MAKRTRRYIGVGIEKGAFPFLSGDRILTRRFATDKEAIVFAHDNWRGTHITAMLLLDITSGNPRVVAVLALAG